MRICGPRPGTGGKPKEGDLALKTAFFLKVVAKASEGESLERLVFKLFLNT